MNQIRRIAGVALLLAMGGCGDGEHVSRTVTYQEALPDMNVDDPERSLCYSGRGRNEDLAPEYQDFDFAACGRLADGVVKPAGLESGDRIKITTVTSSGVVTSIERLAP